MNIDPRNWFKKKQEPQVKAVEGADEQKSVYGGESSYGFGIGTSFAEYLLNSGYEDLSAFASIVLYKRAMPLFNAVNMRAESFAQIPVRVKEKKTGEFIEDHPVMELLEKPNADVSQQEFLEQMASYYDITGENFTVATGRINQPPLELVNVGPQLINFSDTATRFGILNVPNDIRVNKIQGGQLSFKAQEMNNALGLRFLNSDENSEIWHIRSFNPLRSSNKFRGMSRAQPIWMELQQYVSGNTTNLSNLKRGTRLSMAWVNSSDVPLTDEQWTRMQEEAQKYSGDLNAGGTPILDGMDVKPIQQTNREMQFKDLQEAMLARVSSTYRIPLALLLPATMTLNNLQTSMLQFFDSGVLPLTSRLYNEMTRMLMPRYNNSDGLMFAFNENDITALKVRILESAKLLSEIDVNTIDEIRNVIGDGPLANGGEQVFRNASLIPVGDDFDPTDTDNLNTDDF